ncbi:hypothetical protein ABT173_01865 [Streptomyces sp. NPDC001795]|uniref:hypothetical protein n=1 Tax=Streptomyces sp. NPDC001795 TaxID=3154525 RepID=UPI003328397F
MFRPHPFGRNTLPPAPDERGPSIRTIPRNHTRVLAALRQELTGATRHNGARDTTGTPVPPQEAWSHYDNPPPRGGWPLLRELDPRTGTYEIRVSGKLRYELRREQTQRIDIVVDRDPDGETGITVYIDGVKTTGTGIHVHQIDPGASGADHAWLDDVTAHDDAVPAAVRDEIDVVAADYHRRLHYCSRATCDG